MSEQKEMYTATDSVYREQMNKILDIDREIKELNRDKHNILAEAQKKGCNPKILKQMVRITKMRHSDQAALQDALDMA